MKTLLICHDGAPLHSEGLARWLASFSELAGIVMLHEPPRALWRRVRRERARVGWLRLLDVLAFRAYYALVLAGRDRRWARDALAALRRRYAPVAADTPVLHTASPNSPEAVRFIHECAPDVVLALCKALLKPEVFSIPRVGTFVLHPGICPEYRNAHGCFWALARGDLGRVGMTLLRIDAGVDTGPIYGYYSYAYDEASESHVVIQHRVVLENLDALRDKLLEVTAGRASVVDTRGRASAAWGQPWLTRYLKWKSDARRRRRAHRFAALP